MEAEDSAEQLAAVLSARVGCEAVTVQAGSLVEEAVMPEAAVIVAAEAAVTADH